MDGFELDFSDGGFLCSFPNRADEGIKKLIEVLGEKFPPKHRPTFGINDGCEQHEMLSLDEQLTYLIKLSREPDICPEILEQFNSTLESLIVDLYNHPLHIFLGSYRDANEPKKFQKQLIRHEGCNTDLSLDQWKSIFSMEWVSCVAKMGIVFVLLGREIPKTTLDLLEVLKDSYPPISIVEKYISRCFSAVSCLFYCYNIFCYNIILQGNTAENLRRIQHVLKSFDYGMKFDDIEHPSSRSSSDDFLDDALLGLCGSLDGSRGMKACGRGLRGKRGGGGGGGGGDSRSSSSSEPRSVTGVSGMRDFFVWNILKFYCMQELVVVKAGCLKEV